jgi:chromosome segregation ATPase
MPEPEEIGKIPKSPSPAGETHISASKTPAGSLNGEFSMIKKLLVVAVVGGLAVAAVKSTKLGSHFRAEVKSWREAAEDQISPESEIVRLRGEVKNLDEDTIKIVKQLARLQSDQADLQGREKTLTAKKSQVGELMASRETSLRAAEAKAKAGESNVKVTFGEQEYSLESGRNRLRETVSEYMVIDKELTFVRMKTESQAKIVDKLDRQRLEMGRLKTDLEAAIDELEVEVQALKLQQMESKYQTDDTRVAQIKESIQKQRKRLDVQRRELNLLQDTVAPSLTTNNETVDDIMAPVKGKKPAITKSGD